MAATGEPKHAHVPPLMTVKKKKKILGSSNTTCMLPKFNPKEIMYTQDALEARSVPPSLKHPVTRQGLRIIVKLIIQN